ncbi:MAG TPA: glycosyltransferase [Thermoanaerobaculia bacterium]|jgi:glycosyltransferase involved in cell wall biosynthesis|nr:glycosyltransferase [Thermoanaerobaculia bacterium]
MKIICIHPRLAGYSSHHFNEAHGFMEEFDRRGTRFVLLVNAQAQPGIVAELRAHAVLDDPTFRLEWSFEERSHRFVRMLHKNVDWRLSAGDRVLITVSTQLEAHALTRWLRGLPRRKKPWIVILFVSDRWNRAGRDEYDRQIAEFRALRTAITNLAEEDARRLIFCTLTDLLAEELSELLGTTVDVAPLPLDYYGEPRPLKSESRPSSLPRVAILGGTRREKGSYLIPDIIRACQSVVEVEFLVHLTNNTLSAEEAARLALIAGEPRVSVIREALPLSEYKAAFDSADIALFPYEVIPYRKRVSGVFAEAVTLGMPVIATAGTWMAEQIEAGRAAGAVSEDLQPDSIARAIARCVADLESLQQAAQALSVEWRTKTCLSAFVDFMEGQIARRSPDETPPRRSWWPW